MTVTYEQWNDMLGSENLARGKRVLAVEARRVLLELGEGETMATNALVERIYPRAVADQTLAGDIARTQMYKLIGVLALTDLSDACEKGEPNGQYMGKPKRPWIWFKPIGSEICCMCGQVVHHDAE